MGELIKSKLKAMVVHFAFSVVVFFGVLYFILWQWYPGALVDAEGGWKGLKLMAAVDLVLGPVLTFIIYNNKKSIKEITFDITIVVIIQLSALVWGGMQVYSERPVALVMWEGVFYTVTNDYYVKQNVSLEDLSVYSEESPLLIYAETNHSLLQLEETSRLNQMKIPSYAQVHLYLPVRDNVDKIFKHHLSNNFLALYMKSEDIEEGEYIFLGKAKYKKILVILDKNGKLKSIKSIE